MSGRNASSACEHTEWFYREVDRCAKKGLDLMIANSRPEHARYIIMKLFSVAQNDVKIYSGALTPKVPASTGEEPDKTVEMYAWEKLIKEAVSFLKRGNRLSILTQRDIKKSQDHPLLRAFRENKLLSKVNFYVLKPDARESLKDGAHFMVADKKGFRFEIKPKEFKAVANFNDTKTSKSLSKIFEKMIRKWAQPVDYNSLESISS